MNFNYLLKKKLIITAMATFVILLILFVKNSFFIPIPQNTSDNYFAFSSNDTTKSISIYYTGDSTYDFINISTNPNDTFKISFIGDSQRRGFWESLYWDFWGEENSEKTKMIFHEISKRKPNLLIHLGDLTTKGSSISAWEEFEQDNKPIIESRIPYFTVFGNHDYMGDIESCYKNIYSHFPDIAGKKWYSILYQNICILMLNSNFSDLSETEISIQNQWFLKMLDRAENDVRVKSLIIVTHHPPYTNSTIVSSGEKVRNYFAETFKRTKKGQLFISGHSHSYEKFIFDGKIFINSGGGGGPRQKLNINKQTREFDDKYDGPKIRFFHFDELILTQKETTFRVIKLLENGLFTPEDEFKFK